MLTPTNTTGNIDPEEDQIQVDEIMLVRGVEMGTKDRDRTTEGIAAISLN